jgi:hypothetical protein
MSLLSWLFGSKPAPESLPRIHGNGRYPTEVTDCDLFQPALEKLCAGLDMEQAPLEVDAELIELPYDPANRHPVNVLVRGKLIGHLSNRESKRFLHLLHRTSQGMGATCPVRVVWHPDPGPSRPVYTASLDLPH